MNKIPRVTEILKPFTSYDKVPSDILKRAAARGTTVHALCAGIAKGAWIPDGMIEPDFLPYVNSFRQWADAQVTSFEIVEKRFTDEELLFTGQLDFVVVSTDGKLYLVDLKTSAAPQKTYPLQMGAYDYLLKKNGIHVEAALIVYLKKDGSFPDLELVAPDMFFPIFLSALDCWKYFHKSKRNEKV